jgi:CRP-like cAMP-binding protein
MDQPSYLPLGDYVFPVEMKTLIHKHGVKIHLDADVYFQHPGENSEYLYYVETGKVLLGIWGEQGEERIIEILGPNNFCASASVLASIPDRIFLATEAPTVLYKIDKDTVHKLLKESDLFRDTIVKYISTILIRMITLIEGISFQNCKDRIYNLLKISSDRSKLIDQQWYQLRYPYSQSDIARIVGASRTTVSRLISELCDEGLTRYVNRSIQVKD